MLKSIKKITARNRKKDGYWSQAAKLDFALDIVQLMERRGINKAELAQKIMVAPPYVTKALRGDANLTIDSMVKFARALQGKVCIKIVDENAEQRWFEVFSTRNAPAAHAQNGWAKNVSNALVMNPEELPLVAAKCHERKQVAA